MIKIEVSGLRELGEALKALPREVSGRSGGPLAGALRSAARVFEKAARANVRSMPTSDTDDRDDYIRSGRLERSIRSKRDPNPKGVTERVVVKPRGGRRNGDVADNRAPYWDEVEFGTEKMPARPFMRPAANANAGAAVAEFKVKFAKAIDRAAKKAAKLGLKRRG